MIFLYCIGATTCTRQEIKCLPYVFFFVSGPQHIFNIFYLRVHKKINLKGGPNTVNGFIIELPLPLETFEYCFALKVT